LQQWNQPQHSFEENEKLVWKYLSQISLEDVTNLRKIYEIDFKLFDYSFNFNQSNGHSFSTPLMLNTGKFFPARRTFFAPYVAL